MSSNFETQLQQWVTIDNQMKVLTAVVNNPIFIEIQYYTLKKYMIF